MPAKKKSPPRDVRDMISFQMATFCTLNDRLGQLVISRRFGLSLREWRTLATIAYIQNPSATSLARASFLDKAQISRIVSKLVDVELVQRVGTESRGGVLQLTKKGRRLHREGLLFSKHHNDRLLTPLSEEEVAQLRDLLDQLTAEAHRRYKEAGGDMFELNEPTASSPKGWGRARKQRDNVLLARRTAGAIQGEAKL